MAQPPRKIGPYAYGLSGGSRSPKLGVFASPAMGHFPPRLPTVLFFGHFRAAQTLDIGLHVVSCRVKNIHACNFVAVYRMNFRNMFVCQP